jgi:hypothetical protein
MGLGCGSEVRVWMMGFDDGVEGAMRSDAVGWRPRGDGWSVESDGWMSAFDKCSRIGL